MKRLLSILLILPSLFGQVSVTATTDTKLLAQKFFGSGPPASVPTNLPLDLYLDQTADQAYICKAPQGTPAPACKQVAPKNWTLLATSSIPIPTPTTVWSMGFWTPWNSDPNAYKISAINWAALSHIMYVAVYPLTNGSLGFSDSNFGANATALVQAGHQNNVKVLLNVWTAPGSDFQGAISQNPNTFFNNLMQLVNQYNFDGIDIDWEAGMNQGSMTTLLSNLRTKLGTRILTADAIITDSAYWGTAAQYLDRVNVMTYDLQGTWNPFSWVNSALMGDPPFPSPCVDCVWSVDLAKRKFIAAGVPASKLNIGLPFYGWTSTGGGITGPRQNWNATKPSMAQINYSALATQFNVSNPAWDQGSHTPFIQIPNGWLTFDNQQSLTEKIQYVKQNTLGGWIIWALDQDYMQNQAVKHPLLAAVQAAR